MTYSLLVVEDNRDILLSVTEYLEIKGFEVDAIGNGQAALSLIQRNHYDLVILDLGLPGLDGLTLCQTLRAEELNPLPVIMLTARDTLDDRLAGFAVGTDDYLVKPFALPELYERVKAVLKRSTRSYERQLRVGDLRIDVGQQQASRGGTVLKLDRKSFVLLELLMKQCPNVVSHDQLCQALWGSEPPDSTALKTHIYRLRQAVDNAFDTPYIKSVPGLGYRLVCDEN